MDIDTSVLEQFRSEIDAIAHAIGKHLDSRSDLKPRTAEVWNSAWRSLMAIVTATSCTRCEHERVGVVDVGLDGFLCAECAEQVAA